VRDLHRRAERAIRLLLLRQSLLVALTVGGGIVLARHLEPTDFGVFAIAHFVVSALGLVTNGGLKGALIQRPQEIRDIDLRTAFTLNQCAATGAVILVFGLAPWVAALNPAMPPETTWLTRVLALDLYLLSWRSLSEVQLERRLRYEELALTEVVGSLVFQLLAVGLVVTGHGVWSLVWALLAGSALRTVLLYRVAPWRTRPGFDAASARSLLRTGVPLQLTRLVSLLPWWVTPTVVGGLIGPHAVGLLHWAAGIGLKPLEAIENVVRVSLAHFSRLQGDAAEVERILSRYVLGFLAVCGLWFCVLLVAGDDLVRLVYTDRWLPAVPALVLFAALANLGAVRRISVTALAGLGRARVAVRVTALASALGVATSLAGVVTIGFLGVPIGHMVAAGLAVPLLLGQLRRGAAAKVLRPAAALLAPAGCASAIGALALAAPLAPGPRALVAAGSMGLAYAAVGWWIAPQWLREALREQIRTTPRRVSRRATSP
jgi:PST family polysaccharide transporter